MFNNQTIRAEQFTWRKAGFCASGQCVEVAEQNGMIALRDSKRPHGHMVKFTRDEWNSFINAIKAGKMGNIRFG